MTVGLTLEVWLTNTPNECLLKTFVLPLQVSICEMISSSYFSLKTVPHSIAGGEKWFFANERGGCKTHFQEPHPGRDQRTPLRKRKKSSKNGAKGPDALAEARKNQVSSIASWNERSPTLLARIVWRGRCKQPLKGWATPRV